ncbi:MAG: matrixin family metalloprotease [Nanoarchaeota archaeon]
MEALDYIVLIILSVSIFFGAYLFWINLPVGETQEYELIKPNIKNETYQYNISNNVQFYPRMRYVDREIRYSIDVKCDLKKQNDILEALSLISSQTLLRFYESENNTQISFVCSEIEPSLEQKNHFVAGEGGPTEIINTSLYYVIFSGKVSLFRTEKCPEPKIALHEILHALGFDHNSNENSIMYPITKCDQQFEKYIIDEINELYKTDSLPDLAIYDVSASKTGRYLDFKIEIDNQGLKDVINASLNIIVNSNIESTFNLEGISIGTRKIMTAENVKVSLDSEEIVFMVKSDSEKEISLENNKVSLLLSSD